MEFSEKLSTLLSLTATKNVSLARAINIDTAQISRMKTGVRKMPTKSSLVRDIATYLAGCFGGEYRISALYELTGDIRLQMDMDEFVLAGIIYDWLISPDMTPKNQSGCILNHTDDISMHGRKKTSAAPATSNKSLEIGNTGFVAYYNNEGKRRAVRDLITNILSIEKPCTIRVFTDECMDWLLEDSSFTHELADCVNQIAKKGFKVQRINPPAQDIESSFRSIERWLSAYMSGSLKLFYYPRARDELHRRTMVVVPGHIVMHSESLEGQIVTPMTILTTDKMTLKLTDEHYGRILERCRPVMNVYNFETPVKPDDMLKRISQIEDFGICKSSRLSIHTIPPKLLADLGRRGKPRVRKMCDSYARSAAYCMKVLENHTITDIICLPDLTAVLNGSILIPGTKISPDDGFYYTSEEYRMHLEHILWYLDTFPNYQAVILDEPFFENIIIYLKGYSCSMLIKESDSFSLFEITQQRLASDLCNYLRHFMKDKMRAGSRHAAIARIKEEIQRLDSAVNRV